MGRRPWRLTALSHADGPSRARWLPAPRGQHAPLPSRTRPQSPPSRSLRILSCVTAQCGQGSTRTLQPTRQEPTRSATTTRVVLGKMACPPWVSVSPSVHGITAAQTSSTWGLSWVWHVGKTEISLRCYYYYFLLKHLEKNILAAKTMS